MSYVVNRGQTTPSPQIIGQSTASNAFLRFQRDGGQPVKARPQNGRTVQGRNCKLQCMYNHAGCFVLAWWSRRMAGKLSDTLTRNEVGYCT